MNPLCGSLVMPGRGRDTNLLSRDFRRAVLVGALLVLAVGACGACDEKSSPTPSSGAERSGAQFSAPGDTGDGPRQIKGPPGFMDPAKRAARLQKQLELSAKQTVEVEAALRDNADPRARKAAVRALLTKGQARKFDEFTGAGGLRRPVAPNADRARDRGDDRSTPVRFAERLQRHLSLTDDQTAKLAAVLTEGGSREQRMASVKAVLTAEQFARYESLYNRGPGPVSSAPVEPAESPAPSVPGPEAPTPTE